MRKKLLALLMALTMLLAAAPAAMAESAGFPANPVTTAENNAGLLALPFKDVSADDAYYTAVNFVYENKLFNGISEDEFGPDIQMTRAMFVTVLGRYKGLIPSEHGWVGESSFDDVPADEYYAPYVAWAADREIVKGIGDNLFDPGGFITREQMYVILARYADVFELDFLSDVWDGLFDQLTYADDGNISSWARGAVARMQLSGVLSGVEGGYLNPANHVNRAEIAQTLMRYVNSLAREDGALQAQLFVTLMYTGDFDSAYSRMDTLMKADIDGMGGMEAFYDKVIAHTGEIWGIADITYASESMGYDVYLVTVLAENGEYLMQVILDSDSSIAGFLLMLTDTDVEPRIEMPDGYVEEAVTLDAGTGYPLDGYVVRPEDEGELIPAVLLVHGSGPADHDEKMGVNRVFGKIARGLAERGVATLRYDKRTYSYREIASNPEFSVQDEFVEDVLAAVELLKAQPGVDPDRVYILGHSMGGMLAPMFVDAGADVAGMIFFAGSPRHLLDIAYDQQQDLLQYYKDSNLDEVAEAYVEMIEAWEAERTLLDTMTEAEAKSFEGTVYDFNAYYIYVLNNYDAIATIKKLAIPTLILQGSNDLQVFADVDYEIYKSELGGEAYVSFKLYEGLSHGFMPSAAKYITESLNEYGVQMDIPEDVFDDISDWIAAN